MKNYLLLIPIVFVLISCKESGIRDKNDFILPDGAIPIIYRGHIYIDGKADSIQGMFVFDTGASNFYLDSIFYHDNDYSYENTITGILPGAGTKSQQVEVIVDSVSFDFNKNCYKTKMVPVLKLKPILGDFADGILGMEYFYKSVLEVDYLNEYVRVYNTIDSVDVVGYKKIKLSMIDNRLNLAMSVRISDSLIIKGDYLVDLGCGSNIIFTNSTVEKYQLHKHIKNKIPYYTKYGGVGGESMSYDFRANSVSIADFGFDNVTMEYSIDKSGALSNRNYMGLLGNGILEKFDILIDFLNMNLYLKPNKSYLDEFKFPRLSFTYVDRQEIKRAWIVTGLYKNGNAEKADLQIDDKILVINGKPIDEIPYQEQTDFFDGVERVDLLILRNNEEKKISFDLNPIL